MVLEVSIKVREKMVQVVGRLTETNIDEGVISGDREKFNSMEIKHTMGAVAGYDPFICVSTVLFLVIFLTFLWFLNVNLKEACLCNKRFEKLKRVLTVEKLIDLQLISRHSMVRNK